MYLLHENSASQTTTSSSISNKPLSDGRNFHLHAKVSIAYFFISDRITRISTEILVLLAQRVTIRKYKAGFNWYDAANNSIRMNSEIILRIVKSLRPSALLHIVQAAFDSIKSVNVSGFPVLQNRNDSSSFTIKTTSSSLWIHWKFN